MTGSWAQEGLPKGHPEKATRQQPRLKNQGKPQLRSTYALETKATKT